ncbi:MAG: class I SAM-dependent methyltransferase, partial [Flavobacteriales bacterium]
PQTPNNYRHCEEWKLREFTANRALSYFQQKKFETVLDLGCGNGWFTNALANNSNQVVGLDMNMHELKQASRVFGKPGLSFCYADVFTSGLPKGTFSLVTINAAIQYFSNLEALINRLLDLLTPDGEIHILDSPLYKPHEVASAQKRTEHYFTEIGFPEMAENYFHHSENVFQNFNYEVLFKPNQLKNKVTRKLGFSTSPFPWIVIKK